MWRRRRSGSAEPPGDAEALLRRGAELDRRGDRAAAEEAYRHADAAGSGDGAAHLGMLLYERGAVTAAHAALVRADERGSGTGSFRLGFLLQEQGDESAGEVLYRRAVERDNDDAANNLAVMLSQRGDWSGAREAWERLARSSDPRSAAEGRERVRRIDAAGGRRPRPIPPPDFDPDASLTHSLAWIAGDPTDPRVRRARELAFEHALRVVTDDPAGAEHIATLFRELGETARADQVFWATSAADPGRAGPAERRFWVGWALATGRAAAGPDDPLDAATGALRQAVDVGDPEWSPRASYVLGDVWLRRGDLDQAERALGVALESRHRDWRPAALVVLGVVHATRHEHDAAERCYRDVIDVGHPEWAPGAWYNLGTLHQQLEQFVAACDAYRRATASGRHDWAPKAAVNLGYVLFTELDDEAGARLAFQLAVDADHPEQSPLAAMNLQAIDDIGPPGSATRAGYDSIDEPIDVAGRSPDEPLKRRWWLRRWQ